MNLQFAHIEYSIQTKSIDIFNYGCDGSCPGCFNGGLKDWNLKGMSYQQVLDKVQDLVKRYTSLIDKIILVGGDPLDAYNKYPNQYIELLKGLQPLNLPIFLFTRHSLECVQQEVIQYVQYVKTGPYLEELTCDNNICYGIKLATSNQTIHKVQ